MSPSVKSSWALPVALVALAAFGWGLWRLFELRFASGEVYPAHSTLSTTPRGARACYESLDALEAVTASRNFTALSRFKGAPGATLVFAGAGAMFFGEDAPKSFEMFEGWLRGGLHVVATLDATSLAKSSKAKTAQPLQNPWSPWREEWKAKQAAPAADPKDPAAKPAPEKEKAPAEKKGWRRLFGPKKEGEGDGEEEEETLTAAERWDFGFVRPTDAADDPAEGWDLRAHPSTGLSELPRWHSPWRFEAAKADWEVLASADGRPAIIRRAFGDGSLTLVSDSTFLTNEALAKAPAPQFLRWLLGSRAATVFEETHHGTSDDPGLMSLARRYGLLGFFAGLAVFLGLFVWRSSRSLIPPPDHDFGPDGAVAGAAGTSGLINLLKQGVPVRQILRTCFDQWAKTPLVRRRFSDPEVAAIRDTIQAAETEKKPDPVATYRAIAAKVSPRRL